ncbi:MAG: hypothetical protein AB7F35_00630 [Acetobacteraceae bacterium]
MLREIMSGIGAVPSLNASLSSDTNGASVDRSESFALGLLLAIGAGGVTFSGTDKVEFKWEVSDDNSAWSAAAQGDINLPDGTEVTLGTGGIFKTLNAAHAAITAERFNYVGGKRYHRIVADFSGTHGSPTPIAATFILGKPKLGPAA